MSIRFILILATFLPGALFAQQQAVKDVNFLINAYKVNYDYFLSERNTTGLAGEITLPLSTFAGVAFSYTLQDSKQQYYYSVNNESLDRMLGAAFIIRDYNVGGIRFDYSRLDSKITLSDIDDDYAPNFKYHRENALLQGEYYFENTTLTLARLRNDLRGSKNDTNILVGSWYSYDNLRWDLSLVRPKNAQESRSLNLDYQPRFLKNRASFQLGYSKSDYDQKIVSFGFSIYFGSNVSLKERDRKYL